MTSITGASAGAAGVDTSPVSSPTKAIRPRRKPRKRKGRLGWWGTPYMFILLAVGLLLLFTYTPVVNMFWYSVTSWDGLSKEQDYVGVANYIRVFTRPEYFQVFYVSLFYFVASFAQLGIALYFATILSFQTCLLYTSPSPRD